MRSARKAILWLALLGLLCVSAVRYFGTHDDAFTEQDLLEANAADLTATIVTPHLEAAIADGKNILWCGSFQLAWNEACALVGEDLRFSDEPAMTAVLNKKSFTKDDIDTESYVAVADFVKDDVFGRIAQELEDKFRGRATPHYIPPSELTPRPQDFVVYSYLYKNLEFEIPFERIAKPIVFGSEEVPCFGIGEEFKHAHFEMFEQLLILDYRDEDDFVVELKTKSVGDRLILAKIQPQANLAATIETVQGRAANPEPKKPLDGAVLKIPKLNFDITRRFTELEGRQLLHQNPQVARRPGGSQCPPEYPIPVRRAGSPTAVRVPRVLRLRRSTRTGLDESRDGVRQAVSDPAPEKRRGRSLLRVVGRKSRTPGASSQVNVRLRKPFTSRRSATGEMDVGSVQLRESKAVGETSRRAGSDPRDLVSLARCSRAKNEAAWSSPTIFSAFGSHLIARPSRAAIAAQMAGVHRLDVAVDVGDRQPAFADAAVEVVLVAFVRLALVEPVTVLVGVLAFVPVLFDRLAGDLAAVDEDPALGALEQDAVVAAAGRRSSRCRWRTCTSRRSRGPCCSSRRRSGSRP